MSKIEDKFHFLLECPHCDRLNFVCDITTACNNFYLLSAKDKFFWILNNEDKNILVLLYNYISNCFLVRNTHSLNSEDQYV